nr:carboxypeptidase-like regulatory domain-containing protein [uncultured Flavobacterium sp.]
MRCYLAKITISILIFFSIFSVQAQTNMVRISLAENKDKSIDRAIINATVELKNTTNTTIEGRLEILSTTESLYVLQNKSKAIILNPNESLFIAVKAMISTTASPENLARLEAHFTFSNSKEKISSFLPIVIKEMRLVKMIVQQVNLLYEQVGDSLRIPIRLLNDGNSTQTITILANYPEFVSKNRIENNTITIKAHTDSLLILKKEINREILKQEEFSIAIRSLYQNGDIIGFANIRANPIKQSRRYKPEFVADYSNPFSPINQITTSQQTSNSHQNVMAFYGNAQAEINKGTVYTNLDLNWWEQSNQTFMRNTWIGYKEKTFGLQVGNISKFNDLNLIGRGIETFFKTSTNKKIEAGFLEKSYSVIDFSTPSTGQSAWVSFTNKDGWDKGYKTAVLIDNDSNEAIQKALVTNQFSIIQKPNFSLQTGTAISTINSTENTNQKLGAAAEVNLHGKTTKLFYNSLNYFSSGYFAGIKSGAVNLNESIHVNLEKYSFWLSANHFSFAPKTIKTTAYFSSEFSNTQLSTGISKRLGTLFFSLSLTSISEIRKEPVLVSPLFQEYKMNANRVTIGGNYFKNNHSFNLSLEGGFFTTNLNPKQQLHFKTNLNYTWNFFNLTAYYQHNNFYLGEIIATQQQVEKNYFNCIISPSIQMHLLNKKLHLRAGIMYSKNNFTSNTLQSNSRIDFDWDKNLNLFINNFYSDFSNSFQPVNTIQFGLTQRFNPIQIDASKSDLELYLFYDTTGNGAIDSNNKPAINQLVIINDKAFKTNEHGIIKYKRLPSGYYEIRPVNSNEWHAPLQKIKIEKTTKIAIGLSRTSTIKGSIRYFSTENSFSINQKIAGLSVILTDSSGNVFYTKTDEAGKFIFYVPKNYYTVTLEKKGLSEYVTVLSNNINIQAIPEKIIETDFVLQVKEKRIETKKFGNQQF